MFKKINNKQLTIITSIIYILIVTIYELFYCNFEFFTKIISQYNFSFFRILFYIAFYITFYKFKDKFINSVLESFDNGKKCIITQSAITIIGTLIVFCVAIMIFTNTLIFKLIISIISLLLLLLFFIYVTNDMIKNVIAMCLIFGIIFSITITINNQLDEKKHFLSTYSLALGNFNYKNPTVDTSIANIPRGITPHKFLKYFAEKPENTFVKNFTAPDECDAPANYMPVSYIFSSIGIFLAKISGGSIADIYFAGRIFNLFGYMILTILVLKILPYKKRVFYSVFFMPMLLCLSSIYSPDGIAIGLISIFIAYCLKLYEQKESVKLKQLLILILTFLLMAISKSTGYIFISLVVLILPIKKIFKENKKICLLILIFFCIILSIIFISTYNSQIHDWGDSRSEGTNSKQQLLYILKNPIEYASVLLKHTLFTFFNLKVMSFLNAPMFFGSYYYYTFIPLLVFIICIGLIDNKKTFNMKIKLVFLITFISVFITTSTALYLSYTKVGANYIDGYQMRYIFPIIPLFLMCISLKTIPDIENKCKDKLYITYIIATFIILSIAGVISKIV